jgi:hypothetical protein
MIPSHTADNSIFFYLNTLVIKLDCCINKNIMYNKKIKNKNFQQMNIKFI